ncbi:MAG: Lin0512 family protein [Burkholderiaceae bacterium]|nr:Lin0512 family protein [Burkholderiaceae bacterium]
MALKRMVVELGMGTDLNGADYTKAAERALRDALWHNALTIAPALGFDRNDMFVEVTVGVARPELVDTTAVQRVLPYGKSKVTAVRGGLDIPDPTGTRVTVIANAAAVVYLDIE